VKRTGRVPFMKLQIGIFTLLALGLLLWATFQSGSLRLTPEEKIRLRFEQVGGLEEGAPVRLSGVIVGIVREVELEPRTNQVLVTLGVKDGTRARLHQGASARITTVGFLAELYLALEGGNPADPSITSDDQIATSTVTDPQVIVGQVKNMADTLGIFLSNVNQLGRNIASGRGTLGRLAKDERLYSDLVTLSRTANTLAVRMDRTQARLSERLISLSTSLDSLTHNMQHGEGTFARLMTSDELYRNLQSSTARMDSVLSLLESGRGSFGKMVADSSLYDDTRALMGSMKRLMADIEKDPKKYFKFSVF
jgi:phospholipid/cholesterol/gamma-HCH transport system substrate-binding protein